MDGMDFSDYIECVLSEIRDGNEDFPLRADSLTRHSYFTRAGAGGDRPLLLSAALPYHLRADSLTRYSYFTRAEVRNKACGCRLGTVGKNLDLQGGLGDFGEGDYFMKFQS